VKAAPRPPGVRARQRSRAALLLLALAAGSTSLAVAGQVLMQVRQGEQRASGQVFAGLAGRFDRVQEIRIHRPDGSFSVVRQSAPDDGSSGWVLPQRGGYPASREAVDRLADALIRLELVARRTSDPAQYTRLGVGEPREGAEGTGIELLDRSGAVIGEAVVGRRGEALYVRRSGDPTVYLARPALPDLASPAALADLVLLQIGPEDIASAAISDVDSTISIVRRPDGGLAPQGGRPTPAATAAGIALSRFQPLDVVPRAESPSGSPPVRHTTLTRTGLSVTLELWPVAPGTGESPADAGGALVAVRAAAEPGSNAASAQAAALNRRTDGWLFHVDAAALADLAPPHQLLLGDGIEVGPEPNAGPDGLRGSIDGSSGTGGP
jgi:hypothetical protein